MINTQRLDRSFINNLDDIMRASEMIKSIGGDMYNMTVLSSNLSIGLPGNSQAYDGQLQQLQANDQGGQIWKFDKRPDGTYYIYNVGSGQHVAIIYGSMDSNAQIVQYPIHGGGNFIWALEKVQ